MTALLTADEAARLVPGEQLVIIRAGDKRVWEYQDEHNNWQPGTIEFVAPQAWVALTGLWTGQVVLAGDKRFAADGGLENGLTELTEDGRRMVPLYTECPESFRRHIPPCPACNNAGRVQVGRGSIEVVPVVGPHFQRSEVQRYVLVGGRNVVFRDKQRGAPFETVGLTLDPLPVPGRDFGILIDCIDCVEVVG